MDDSTFHTMNTRTTGNAAGRKQDTVTCANCDFYGILGVLNSLGNDAQVNCILKRRQPLAKGETLFRADQPFHAAYAVTGGSLMSYQLLEGGDEQVLGFHFPGELFGLDGLRAKRYGYTVRALEPSLVCELRFEDLNILGDRYPAFQEQLIELMSGQILHVQRQTLLASRQSSDERLAAFLLNIAERLAKRGFPAKEFRLPMSRQDISSYLGLAVETVSRLFRRFQEQGLLKASGKHVCLLDVGKLEAIARAKITL